MRPARKRLCRIPKRGVKEESNIGAAPTFQPRREAVIICFVPNILAGIVLPRIGAGHPASFSCRPVRWPVSCIQEVWMVGKNRTLASVIPIEALHLFAPKHYSHNVILHVLLFFVSLVVFSLIHRAK